MWLALSQVLLWVLVLALGFLLLGTLRVVGLLSLIHISEPTRPY